MRNKVTLINPVKTGYFQKCEKIMERAGFRYKMNAYQLLLAPPPPERPPPQLPPLEELLLLPNELLLLLDTLLRSSLAML